MKRTLILSFGLAFLAPIAFVGCGDETKKETTVKESTPTGSKEVKTIDKETKTGDQK